MENERIQQLAELYECQMDVTLSTNDKEELFQIPILKQAIYLKNHLTNLKKKKKNILSYGIKLAV